MWHSSFGVRNRWDAGSGGGFSLSGKGDGNEGAGEKKPGKETTSGSLLRNSIDFDSLSMLFYLLLALI